MVQESSRRPHPPTPLSKTMKPAMERGEMGRVLAVLRDEIRRIERRPVGRSGSLPCGREEIDRLLPGGGFPRGALTELCGGPASGKTGVALAVVRALEDDALAAFIDGRGELYPPALRALGVDLTRLLIVRPVLRQAQDERGSGPDSMFAGLWAAEALLGSGAFDAVAIDVPLVRAVRGLDPALRRVQAAAEKGGTVGVWLTGPDARVRAPAVARVDLDRPAPRDRIQRLRSKGHAA
jgi:protein ImuA